MIILLLHWGLVLLLYMILFGTGTTNGPPQNPGFLRKIHHVIFWGTFYGFYFALAITIGFAVELLAGWYCGHVATGIGFFFTAVQARKIQKE